MASETTHPSLKPDPRVTSGHAAKRSPRQFAYFVLCGALNTLLGWGIYLLLLSFFSYPYAYSIAYALCIFISYYLNTVFVFKEKLRLANALQFPLVYLVQYLSGLGLMLLLVQVAGVSEVIAPFLVVVLTIPVTYKLSQFVIKR